MKPQLNFWMNSTDTGKCFTKDTNAGLITISADLSFDLSTEACQQKHGGIQLGVSKNQDYLVIRFSTSIHSTNKRFNASIELKTSRYPCRTKLTRLLKLSSKQKSYFYTTARILVL